MSAKELLANHGARLKVVQSDASGLLDHGFGYVHGNLRCKRPTIYAARWPFDFRFVSSTHCELMGLHHYVRTTTSRNCMVVWITDSLPGAYAVLKGSMGGRDGLVCSDLLTSMYDIANDKCLQLLAIWVPRELNSYADFLSHLAFYSSQDEYVGRIGGSN